MILLTPTERHERLHRLDACLAVLEDAQLRDERHLSQRVINGLAADLPNLVEGMPTIEAIESVFTLQEPYMVHLQLGPRHAGRRRRSPRPLTQVYPRHFTRWNLSATLPAER
jgi:hypothetical protein